MTALPNPSGFRTLMVPDISIAAMLSARMVRDRIDFNYSFFDGDNQFVYPVQFHKRVMAIWSEVE